MTSTLQRVRGQHPMETAIKPVDRLARVSMPTGQMIGPDLRDQDC